MPRRKSETFPVPADAAEAELMIGELAALERDRLLEELAADEAIAGIKAQLSDRRKELDGQTKPLFEGLKSWWESDGREQLAGRKRSVQLGAAQIGIRLTPPALKTERKVTFKEVLLWLRSLRWGRAKEFLRTKVELDKEAISKAMRNDEEVAKTFAGRLRIEQKDEFFIDTGLTAETVKQETSQITQKD